jgi:hypothetical protein
LHQAKPFLFFSAVARASFLAPFFFFPLVSLSKWQAYSPSCSFLALFIFEQPKAPARSEVSRKSAWIKASSSVFNYLLLAAFFLPFVFLLFLNLCCYLILLLL